MATLLLSMVKHLCYNLGILHKGRNAFVEVWRVLWVRKATKYYIFFTMASVAAINMLIIMNNLNKVLVIILAFIVTFFLLIINTYVLNKRKIKKEFIVLMYSFESFFLVVLLYFDSSLLSLSLFLFLIGQAVSYSSIKFSLIYTIINYFICVFIGIYKYRNVNFNSLLNILIIFTFVYIFTSLLKHEINQRNKLEILSTELEKNSNELQKSYEKLQENYNEKEEFIILKEQNRIAGEIHDTIGHILTTVLIQMEASKKLMKINSEQALQKLNLAQNQVRKGLENITIYVRAINEEEELMDFEAILKSFIKEFEKQSDIKVEANFFDIPKVPKTIKKALYRALQEGFTNGVKHGKSAKFKLVIRYVNSQLQFELIDNGIGCDNLEMGFGLNNMKYRIEQLGGDFRISSTLGEGTIISIKISI